MPRATVDRCLLVLSGVAAAIWFAAIVQGGDAGLAVVAKSLAIPALAAIAWRRQQLLLATALLFHGLGDVLLELYFLAGMAAFWIGHGLYLWLFSRQRQRPVPRWAWVRVGALALASVAALADLAGHLDGVFTVAVPLYAAALFAMAASAQTCRRGQPWVWLGALLFLISDLLLAFALFGGGTVFGRVWVWPTYWTAQVLLALGWLRETSVARDASRR
jgi:uncharacterized membrane protein YhhN